MHKRTKRKDYIRNKNKTKGKSRVKNNILNKLNSDKNLRFNERIPRRLLRDAPVPHSSSVYAHAQPQDSANLRPIGISNLSKVLSLILIVFIGLGLFYYFGSFGITGLVIYSDSTITLDVNSLVSKDAQIFVNVGAEEQIKPITGFDLPLMNESYYVSSLNVDIISLNFSLDPGTYSFVVSLIDNSTLIAITSKDITISLEQPVIERPQEPVQEQVNETNLTLPEIINETNTTVPEPLPEPVVSNISDLSKVEQEVLDEINSKGSARVIVKKTFNLVTTADLINELEQNITIDELRFVKRGELASDIKKEFENNSFDLNDYARLEEEFSETDTSKRVLSVVQLTDGANKLAELINKSEIITVEQEVDDIVALNVDVNMLNKMINLSSVNQIILDNEVNLFVQDAINITKVNVVQQLGYSGNGKSVCILDTGINYNLFGLILNQTIHGYDFVNQDDDPLDDHGHGTSVGNILLNVAPNSNVYAVKVINSNGVGYESDILAGLQYCINNNVDVISFSIGSRLSNGYCDSNIVANKSNYAVEQGIHIIAATGNDGSNTEIRVPACASNVLRVASSNKQDNVSSFSNVYLNDLLAPGQDINTVDLSGNSTALSGSSLSAPLVSGAALLILENQSYNPGNLTHLFRSTSDVIFNDGIRDYERLNLYNALINNITHVPFDYDANQANVTSGEFFGFANPSFNTPTLNSTDVRTNNTNVNISLSIVSTDATGLYNITTWYENNQSLLVLNMPFVTNTTDVKDYSGYNNNGT
ncbi:S8 family serine peptidase, partial [Candidatus Woesearchaeota archaeon]|nr:S8 family serine peptidase [Candidatus Woesearchaeota archaeon]